MKKNTLKILGIILIVLVLTGFLLIGINILGYVISNEKISSIEFSKIEDITLSNGNEKIIPINIKNIGGEDITNCLLLITGEKSDWTKNEETKDILAQTDINFNLKITIPEETEIDDYPLTLQLTCDQESNFKEISIAVTKGVNAIKVREIKSEKRNLNILYTFDNNKFIGESTYVEIWILNPEGFEIKRLQDRFSIKTDNLILRNIDIELEENLKGVYGIFFSHPSDLENYIKKSVILGKSGTSGNAIFKIVKGKGFPYAIFLLIIAIGIFFIFKSHRRAVQNVNQQISKTPKLRRLK
ncbi:hypothetical protein CMI43_03545 [Candidatus Pacearchaeota archaeon]|nr:hypothetical protein [Candidatus Pacearchaeota archaeon]|tara:strand:- start:6362 stop:7258 length:897 start_codon:yes stop_codon:yes gene_type:complete